MKNKHIFSDKYKFERWINIEKAYIKYFLKKDKDLLLKFGPYFDVDKMHVDPFEVMGNAGGLEDEYESIKRTFLSKHPALNVSWFIHGLSYSDLIDTGNSLLIKEWNDSFFEILREIKTKLKELAYKYKDLLQIGRTHGVHAEPTSFGHKFAVCYSDLGRYIDSVSGIRKFLEVVVLNFVETLDTAKCFELQDFLSKELNLNSNTSNQIRFNRGRYISFLGNLNGVAQLINKLSLDLQYINQQEVREIRLSDFVTSKLHRIEMSSKLVDSYLESYVVLENSINKDYSSFIKMGEDYIKNAMMETLNILTSFKDVLWDLSVNEQLIKKNIQLSNRAVYSQSLMLYLLKNGRFDRKEVISDVKKISHLVLSGKDNFENVMANFPKYRDLLNEKAYEEIFCSKKFLINIDSIYKRIFYDDEKIKNLKKIVWDKWEVYEAIEKLSLQLNREYSSEKVPVIIVSFSEKSVVFLGKLLLKLNFPLIVNTFPHDRPDLNIGQVNFDEEVYKLKRILIVDYMVDNESNLDHFVEKIKEKVNVRDVKVCCLIKSTDFVEDKSVYVNWYGFEHDSKFYVGLGKNCGDTKYGRQLKQIGILI